MTEPIQQPRRGLVIVLALLSLATAAAPASAAADDASPWRFEIQPYAWIPGTYGTVDVNGYTAHLDVTPKGRNEDRSLTDWVRHHDRYEEKTQGGCAACG